MKFINTPVWILLCISGLSAYSQNTEQDTLFKNNITLNEVIISVNKTLETRKTIAQEIRLISAKEIQNLQAQSTADLLSGSGNVFVQKSQMGGGSPVIRGFEANRILLVIDGVRMNNIIYRGGHLQNVITLDNSILESIEILYGPASTVYGSDALGGVINLYTKKPVFANDGKKSIFKVNAYSRYGSVNNEITGHFDVAVGGKKFASLSSFTYSKFGDLKSGTTKNPFYDKPFGERNSYVERINGVDSLVKNSDPDLQIQSAFSQYDFLQKFSYRQNEHVLHGLNFQYSTSTDVPRYDRLTDPKAAGLNYAEWYYGPQNRLLAAYDLNYKNNSSLFRNIHAGISYQHIEESRHTRKFNNNSLLNRMENVDILGTNIDFVRTIKSHNIRFGLDGQFNTLTSTANQINIVTSEKTALSTRYPDGNNTMANAAIYLSHTWQLNEKIVLTDGLRIGYNTLRSTFKDSTFFKFPFSKADQNNEVISGSLGIIANPNDHWKLSLLVSTGFRTPNVDDLSKIFESEQGTVIVPNPKLKPEETINYEAGITKLFNQKIRLENTFFYTQFFDAIVTDQFQYNGNDSILYDGVMSGVYANQNKQKAYLYGFSTNFKAQVNEKLSMSFLMNYTYGRIKTDSSDYPLDHIPPFMMRLQFSYTHAKFSGEFFANYNGWKRLKDYYLNGEDNEQYATPEGMPAWFTLNLRVSYKLHKLITIQSGIDNILDTQYRTFASGINAPGRNFFATMRFHY
jgi:hemoglobin/transferrin/lactoferrin receptor protein